MKINMSFLKMIYLIHIIFLIVLQNFAMDSGMGFFGISVLSILLLYDLFIAGVRPGITKMVNVRSSKDYNDSISRILKYGLLYSFIIGMIVVAGCFLFADSIMLSLYGNRYVSPVLQIMAISFLINALLEVVMGYYKGNKNESLLVLINILKCVIPILLSFALIYITAKHGTDVAKLLKNPVVKHAYVAMGISSVYMFALIIILIIVSLIIFRNRDFKAEYKQNNAKGSLTAIFANLIAKGLAYSVNNMFPLLSIAFSGIVYLWIGNKLIGNSNITFNLFGVIFSRIFLPFSFVMILFSNYYTNEIARMRSAYRKDEGRTVIIRAQHSIKNCFFMLLPVSVFFTFFADPFVKVFFTANYKVSAALLQKAGFLVLLIGLSAVLIQLLKSIGKEQIAIAIQFIAFVTQMISLILLLNNSQAAVSSVIYALYINCILQIVLCFPILFKYLRFNLKQLGISISKYIAAAFIMTIIYVLLDRFITMNPFLIILAIIIGYLIYLITIIALKGISKNDVQSLKDSFISYPVEFLTKRLNL